jgi:hypothetical protein
MAGSAHQQTPATPSPAPLVRVHRVGELLLAQTGDLLPAMVDAHAGWAELIGGWACALLGFEAATCFEPEPDQPGMRHRHRSSNGSDREPIRRSQSRRVPRRRAWPEHLEPIGDWVRYQGAFVSGHRRRLFGGRRPSMKARMRAAEVGIALGPRETWVQSHTRGIPEDVEMRFRWRSREALSAT